MRVYLDNCCYNRPFDDQNQLKVHLETVAKLEIQNQMRRGEIEYVWSSVLDFEISRCSFVERVLQIRPWEHGAATKILVNDTIRQRAKQLEAVGVKPMGALHVACAEAAECDWFFTTDRDLLNKAKGLSSMRIANPLDFIGGQ